MSFIDSKQISEYKLIADYLFPFITYKDYHSITCQKGVLSRKICTDEKKNKFA